MTRNELVIRLKGYEWTDFECKKALKSVPKNAYSTVSAFANTEGGWLLFGVTEENGQLHISGVDNDAFDRVQNDFLTTLRSGQKLNQPINVTPRVYDLDGKRILAFWVPESPRMQKPVYLNGNPHNSYIRRAASDERVSHTELQRFMRDSAPVSWDTEPVTDYDVNSNLDTGTVNWYQQLFYQHNPGQRSIEEPVEFLTEWNFIVDQAGKPALTRAAILLFGVDRAVRQLLLRPVLDYQRIDSHYEDWSVNERWHDRLVFEENLLKTWRGLIAKYIRIAEHPFKVDPETLRRSDDPPDYVAFREAAINLLIHQDYGDAHRKASLKLFTDRTEFSNPGNAFASRDELLESTEKEVRNPLLANAFRRIGLSEQAGTGIRAICRNWRELGYRPPIIANDKSSKYFQLILHVEPLITESMQRFQQSLGVRLTPEQADILALAATQEYLSTTDAAIVVAGNLRIANQSLEYLLSQRLLQRLDNDSYALADLIRARLVQAVAAEATVPNTSDNTVRDQVGTKSGPSRDQVEILRMCLIEQAISELMRSTSRTNRTKFRDQVLNPLLNAGWLEMTIPEKPTSSKQKYRLTGAGKHILDTNK